MSFRHNLQPIPRPLRKTAIDNHEFYIKHPETLVHVPHQPSRPDHGFGVQPAHPEEETGDYTAYEAEVLKGGDYGVGRRTDDVDRVEEVTDPQTEEE